MTQVHSENIRDTSRSLSKLTSSLKTMNYRHVRSTADFLGVPPWLLFYHESRNEKLRKLFDSYPSILKPIEIPYFSEYKDYYYDDFLYEISKRVKTTEDYIFIKEKLDELIGHNYHDVISGNWKAVYTYFSEIIGEFSGGAKFSYINSEVKFLGTMRVCSFSDRRGVYGPIRTAWIAIEVEDMNNNQQKNFDQFICKIKSDMYWFIDNPPWELSLKTQNKDLKLFMWHALRTPELSHKYFEKVSNIINPLLPKLNYSMNINTSRNNDSERLIYSPLKEQFSELIELLKEDVPHYYPKDINERRFNTLSLLFENGVIKNGDPIVFIAGKVKLDSNDPRLHASIHIENGKILVKWDFDENIYSISRLTHNILTKYGKRINYKHQPNGNNFWTLVNDRNSLFKKALEIYNKNNL